jgi:hypothetical protein
MYLKLGRLYHPIVPGLSTQLVSTPGPFAALATIKKILLLSLLLITRFSKAVVLVLQLKAFVLFANTSIRIRDFFYHCKKLKKNL